MAYKRIITGFILICFLLSSSGCASHNVSLSNTSAGRDISVNNTDGFTHIGKGVGVLVSCLGYAGLILIIGALAAASEKNSDSY